ncbi:MAG: hypothetical protein HBSAPP03_07860 [Phycisphaerae bacterium]|nr:MAG: hypothetical protein HBSAPP03_07860 [Phycisphaerae bacterium]
MNASPAYVHALAMVCLCGPQALGDSLYSNGSANPAVPALGASNISLSGVPAPSGFFWSECPATGGFANAMAGFSTHAQDAGQFRFADDFAVPPGGWTLQSLTVFAYQPGAGGPASPFTGLSVRLWIGRPGDPGSFIVWGDTTTHAVTSTSTGVYRVFNTNTQPLPATPDTTRLIWATRVELPGVFVGEGTYWIDWQYTGVEGGAFSPAVTSAGSRGSGNAVQYQAAYGSLPGGWLPALDTGKPAQAPDLAQDFPFLLEGLPGAQCDADVNCDGAVNGFDIEVQEAAVGGDMADYCASDADFNQDGAVNGNDVEAVELVVGGGPCP